MCDAITMMIASTAMSVVGGIQQGQAAQDSANYNAALMRNQAAYEEVQARDAITRGEQDVRDVYKAGAQAQGSARAGFSANGLDLAFGSPLDLMLSNARNIEQDAMRTSENAKREADGISFGASQTRSKAKLTEMEGANAKKSAMIGSIGTVLSGGAEIYKYKASVG